MDCFEAMKLSELDIPIFTPMDFTPGSVNEALIIKHSEKKAVIKFLNKWRKKKLDPDADFVIASKRK
jgi:hypothetical protein